MSAAAKALAALKMKSGKLDLKGMHLLIPDAGNQNSTARITLSNTNGGFIIRRVESSLNKIFGLEQSIRRIVLFTTVKC